MMYHTHLKRQIAKYLDSSLSENEHIKQFIKAVNDSYESYERDRELNEHASIINEEEYAIVNERLRLLTEKLENRIIERTKQLSDIAQFPLENPNPIFRVSLEGKILFRNPSANLIKKIYFNSNYYTPTQFFLYYISLSKLNEGTFDITTEKKDYLFYYKKIVGKEYINFYGADITEKNQIEQKEKENFERLNNFLESTQDAYFIIYKNHREKNFITAKWFDFYGFDPSKHKDVFKEREKCVTASSLKHYKAVFTKLKINESIDFLYCIKNKKTGERLWLSEKVSKKYDAVLDDIVLSGRITDVTASQLYALKIKESEERFRSLMDNIPVMVWVSNEKNIITYSNNALKLFLGFKLEAVNQHREYASFVHPDDKRIVVDDWKKSIAKKESVFSEYRLKDSKGSYHNILEKAVPRFFQDGSFAGYIGAYFDLTQEKQFQQNLLQEKGKLELMSQYSPDINILVDMNGVIEYVSPTITRILGYRTEEVLHKKINRFICTNCNKMLKSNAWLSLKNKRSKKYEFQMVHKNGNLIWIDAGLNVIKDPAIAGNKIMLHLRDANSLKQTQEILKQSEQKYRTLFENMQLGVMEVDLKDNIVWVNKSFESMTGYKIPEIKNKNAFKLFLSSNMEVKKMTKITNLRKKKKESIYEVQMMKKNGKMLDVVISGSPVIDIDGSVRGSVGIHWDVTEIRKMEKALDEEKEIIQREVLKATLNSEEKQRQLLGHELHDGVGQMLTYISLYLQVAASNQEYDPKSFIKAQVKVKEALNEVRRISRSLAPPALIDLGLREAIVELLNQYAEIKSTVFKLSCNSNIFKHIEFDAQRTIYRIVQELVNNAIKYASANLVNFTFIRNQSKLVLKYSDDGKGFNPQKIKKGVGLKSINNRVYFYGGTNTVNSIINKGTTFIIEIPLKNIITHG